MKKYNKHRIIEEYITYHEVGDVADFKVKSRIMISEDPNDATPYSYDLDHRTSAGAPESIYYKSVSYATIEEAKRELDFYLGFFGSGKVEVNNRY